MNGQGENLKLQNLLKLNDLFNLSRMTAIEITIMDCKNTASDIQGCSGPINESPDYIDYVEINVATCGCDLLLPERSIYINPDNIDHNKLGKVIKTLLRDNKFQTDITVKYSNSKFK